jgi:hypothetical protein
MKKNTLIAIFLLFVPFIFISASTFPEDEAGISAYVKLDSVNTEMLNKAYNFMEDEGMTKGSSDVHVLGGIPVKIIIDDANSEGEDYHLSNIGVYIYLDLDGWLVAYLLKGEPSSKIVQWSDYAPGSMEPNVLEEAIEIISSEIGSSYSGSPDYYHFEYSEANRMSIIVDTVHSLEGSWENTNFSVTTPGAVKEASYSIYFSKPKACWWILSLNGETVDEERQGTEETICEKGSGFAYDFYSLDDFLSNAPNSVVFNGKVVPSAYSMRLGAATALIYQVD